MVQFSTGKGPCARSAAYSRKHIHGCPLSSRASPRVLCHTKPFHLSPISPFQPQPPPLHTTMARLSALFLAIVLAAIVVFNFAAQAEAGAPIS